MKKKIFDAAFWFCIIACCAFLLYQLFFIEKDPKQIFRFCSGSVVELRASSDNVGESFGSAVLINNEGLFVTNAHVVTYKQMGIVKEFDSFEIRFVFEDVYRQVTLVKYDSEKDLAILKLDDFDAEASPIKVGKSSSLSSGDRVFAIGNTANYGISISEGIVSIPQVNVDYSGITREVIQCDIVIAEGNSGGALVNSKGELVGLTTFRIKDLNGNIIYGLAYTIPVDVVINFLN